MANDPPRRRQPATDSLPELKGDIPSFHHQVRPSLRVEQRSGKHPAQLRDMVTSPGGTSAAALHELERGRLRTVLADAVWAAYRRTMSLSESLNAGKEPDPMPPS